MKKTIRHTAHASFPKKLIMQMTSLLLGKGFKVPDAPTEQIVLESGEKYNVWDIEVEK